MKRLLRKSRKLNQPARKDNPLRVENLEPRTLLSAVGLQALPQLDPSLAGCVAPMSGVTRLTSQSLAPSPAAAISYSTLPSGLPILDSYPGNPSRTTIFLDFDGDSTNPWAHVDPYNLDADPATYNAQEQANIVEVWRETTVYFAMYDVNVTTIQPDVSIYPTVWVMPNPNGLGNYCNGVIPNQYGTIFIFQDDAVWRQCVFAHEIGHGFGAGHTSEYDTWGNKIAEYADDPDPLHGPLMGVDFAGVLHKWSTWHESSGPTTMQDDMEVIRNAIVTNAPSGYTGDGYRLDGPNVDNAHATALTLGTPATDIIERLGDSDYFSLNVTSAGRYSFTLGRDLPSAVDGKLSIYNSSGTLLAAEDGDPRSVPYTMVNDQHLAVDISTTGTYYAVVQSHANQGDSGQYILRADALPANWQSEDIGLTGQTGYAGYVSGTFTLSGSGGDIWDAGDTCQFAYQTLSGDGTVTARVASITADSPYAKSGVMIRQSLAANAANAATILTTSGGTFMQYRTTAGGGSGQAGGPGYTAPCWVRLTRSGNNFTSAVSTDGSNWTNIGTQAVTMTGTVYIGLVVNPHDVDGVPTARLNTSTFTNVTAAATGSGVLNPAIATTTSISCPTTFTSGTQTATSISLSWTARTGTGYAGYSIERSSDGVNFAQIWTTSSTSTTSYTSTGLSDNQRYFYRLRCRYTGGTSFSRDFRALNTTTKAGAVTNLNTMSISQTQITLDWTDAAGEGTYRIQRSANGTSGWTTVGTVPANATTFTNSGLTVNTRYYFRVQTLVGTTVTATSAVVNRYTRLNAVTGLTFTTKASNQMVIAWNAVTGATGYLVERSTDGVNFSSVYTGTSRTYTDNNVTPTGEYYYRVFGTNTTNNTRSVNAAPIFAAAPATTSLPGDMVSADIGAVGGTGTVSYDSGTDNYTIVASGDDIWNTADAFRYVYRSNSGDVWFNTQVVSLERTDGWAKAGVMVRESTAAGAREVSMIVNPDGQTQLQYRDTANGYTYNIPGPVVSFPYWMELDVQGSTISGYISTDGWYENYQLIGSVNMTLPSTYLMGIVVTSHNNSLLNTTVCHAFQYGGWGAAAAASLAAAGRADAASVPASEPTVTVEVPSSVVPVRAAERRVELLTTESSSVLNDPMLRSIVSARQTRVKATTARADYETATAVDSIFGLWNG
jgi:hypothetical protein